jgi:hypothetical protein
MRNGPGAAEATTPARDLRRLLVLGLLTALAVLLCERWSEAGVTRPNGGPGTHVARTQ